MNRSFRSVYPGTSDWQDLDDEKKLDRSLMDIQDIVFRNDHQGIPQLIQYLESKYPRACWGASWALSRLWDDSATKPIAAAIVRVDVFRPVLAHMKGTKSLYGLLDLLAPEDRDWDNVRRAKRLAESLTCAYDEFVEKALLEALEHPNRAVAEGALVSLVACAEGDVLAKVVDKGLVRFPHAHTWAKVYSSPRPDFIEIILGLRGKLPLADELIVKLESPGEDYRPDDPGGYLERAVRLSDSNFAEFDGLWEMLSRPSQSGAAIRGLREILEKDLDRLTDESLQALRNMRDTYLHRFEWFPAGYEYEMWLEIEALDVHDMIQVAKDELRRRGTSYS